MSRSRSRDNRCAVEDLHCCDDDLRQWSEECNRSGLSSEAAAYCLLPFATFCAWRNTFRVILGLGMSHFADIERMRSQGETLPCCLPFPIDCNILLQSTFPVYLHVFLDLC